MPRLEVRLTHGEMEQVRNAALNVDLSVSEFVRTRILPEREVVRTQERATPEERLEGAVLVEMTQKCAVCKVPVGQNHAKACPVNGTVMVGEGIYVCPICEVRTGEEHLPDCEREGTVRFHNTESKAA